MMKGALYPLSKRKKGAVDLPPEVWIQILDRLEKIDVAQVSLVSKQFLSLTNSVCKTLRISSTNIEVLPKVLARLQYLESIIIYTDLLMTYDSFCQVYSSSLSGQEAAKRIKRLNFGTGYSLPEINKILNLFPWLVEISFGYTLNSVPVKRCQELERMTSKLTMLKKVTFISSYFLSDECLTFISSTCVNLEEFHLNSGSFPFGRVCEKTIGFILRNSPKLTTLILPLIHDKCLQDDPLSMANSMPHAKHLHTLCLFAHNLSEELTHSLAKRNASLKKLILFTYNYSYSYDSYDYMRYYVNNNYLLTIFREGSIEDVCIESNRQLTNSLIELISPSLARLTRIHLEKCSKLSNPSFSALTKYCPLLEEVYMTFTSLGLGEMSLTNLHQHNKLCRLRLSENEHLDNDTLKIIIWMCPNLQYLDVNTCLSLRRDGVLEILRTSEVDLLTELNINFVPGNFRIYPEGSRIINLKKLRAKSKGTDDKALGEIGKLCSGLEFLDISCSGKVTDTRVPEIMKYFKNLKSIVFHYDCKMSSFLVSQEQGKLFLKNGCNIDYHSPVYSF